MDFDVLKGLHNEEGIEADRLQVESVALEALNQQQLVELTAAHARIAELEAQIPPPDPPPPPEKLVLFGSSTPKQPRHNTATREGEAKWIESKLGVKLPASRHYIPTGGSWTNSEVQATVDSGRVPVFSFKQNDSWSKVAGGSLDAYVDAQVTALLKKGGPWLKAIFGFENEPEAEVVVKGAPADYVKAWNRLMKRIRDAGWEGPLTSFFMEYTWQKASGRNPDAWTSGLNVDWLGVHVYHTRVGTCGAQGIRSFVDGVDGPLVTADKMGKPMGIFEGGYATKSGTDPEIKANFFRSIPVACEKLPQIMAYIYWNMSGGKCDLPHTFFLDSDGPEGAPMKGFADMLKSNIAIPHA